MITKSSLPVTAVKIVGENANFIIGFINLIGSGATWLYVPCVAMMVIMVVMVMLIMLIIMVIMMILVRMIVMIMIIIIVVISIIIF